MEIKYLTQLNNYPSVKSKNGGFVHKLKPISIDDILILENDYNSGTPFPAALRELLYIAGNGCYVLEMGTYKTQIELQEGAREGMADSNSDLSIPRAFYVIDVYNAGDMFLFVYLDEGKDDPIVFEAVFEGDIRGSIHPLNYTLSQFVNERLRRLLSGENPF